MTPEQIARYRTTLTHVYWIGGPPDAGKTTVSQLVAEAMNGVPYHQDRHELEHIRRADPAMYPRHAGMRDRLARQTEAQFFEDGWLGRPVEDMARESRHTWEERLGMICEDLMVLPADRPVVAEGPGFFPNVIVPLLTRPSQAMWLVPTEPFKRDSHRRREKSAWRTMTSDPDRALRNHIARDIVFAGMYRDELSAAGLPWIEIDGSVPAEVIAERVVGHYRGLPD